ncbi:MAG: lysophospholipid acyltransferase family protein [Thermodesulfobacteriota bacterium]|nr:lysophospholipid acyltransferase family protein [Thermodesulfobacteriota bacterium]
MVIKKSMLRAARMLGNILLAPFFHLETSGIEHLPRKSAFVLLPKHQRWEDIPILSLATPRPIYYIAKYELFKNPLSRWFFTSLGGIPLNRERPLESRGSLKTMVGLLREGEGVVVFPEGTYYKNKMGAGHVGVIRLILSHLSLPFIPVGINYSGNVGRRIRVRVRFDIPFRADPATSPGMLLDRVMREIARLSGFPEERRQVDDGGNNTVCQVLKKSLNE